MINVNDKPALLFSSHDKIGFQGSRGSFSELAVEKYFGVGLHKNSHHTFSQTFKAVMDKKCPYAVVPIENTLIGTVYESFDNFLHFPRMQIVADLTIKISHALIGLPDAKISDIRYVYSQLPGIGQCQRYLSRHKDWVVVPFRDTAAAASHVAQEGSMHNAAIASEKAAEIYNLSILKKGIESNKQNFTRFAIITHKESEGYKYQQKQKETHNAGFLIFTTKDEAGALLHCLEIFAKYNINLHKIESRPIVGRPWEYQFVTELDYNPRQNSLNDCLKEIRKHAVSFHVIGFFRKQEK